ncbi:hypothetical protein HDV06_003890 [Boothiomyces sp. JEL0866]|nr:hypothetical protein HDV06_003890 [Boothiomyces sp. JEL0866]
MNKDIAKLLAKKSREENEKREKRALMLFDYIEQCDKQDIANRRRELNEKIAIQKAEMQEKAIQLLAKRDQEFKDIEMERKKFLEEKRKRLTDIGKSLLRKPAAVAKIHTGSGSAGNITNLQSRPVLPGIESQYQPSFKSIEYYKQAKEHSKYRHYQDRLHSKILINRQKALDVRAPSEKRKKSIHPTQSQNERDNSLKNMPPGLHTPQEVEAFLEKYKRPDSPLSRRIISKAAVQTVKSKVVLSKVHSMIETDKKNKAKTKHLTSGNINQFGFVSAIAENFQMGYKHGYAADDPAWQGNVIPETNKPQFITSQAELKLIKSEINEKALSVPLIKELDQEVDLDQEIKEVVPEENEEEKKKEEKIQEKILQAMDETKLSPEKQAIANKAKNLLSASRYSHYIKKNAEEAEQKLSITKPPIEEDEIHSPILPLFNLAIMIDDTPEEEEPVMAEESITSNRATLTSLRPSAAERNTQSIKMAHNRVSVNNRASRAENNRESTNRSSRKENNRETILDFPNMAKRRKSFNLFEADIPESVSSDIQRYSTFHRKSIVQGGKINEPSEPNPFSHGQILYKPDYMEAQPLANWLQDYPPKNPRYKNYWHSINLEAVAEFGKTLYNSHSAANSAEFVEPVSSRPKYIPSKLKLFSCEDVEYAVEKADASKLPKVTCGTQFWRSEPEEPMGEEVSDSFSASARS